MKYARDMVGYGQHPPHPHWPGEARLALSFVLNYEEGGESTILDGDAGSESILSDALSSQPLLGERDFNQESHYEFGSRAGFWRLHRLFSERHLPVTVLAAGIALTRNREAASAMAAAGWEVASHGYRWINYHGMDEATEREHVRLAIEAIRETTGRRPVGWFTGRISANTRKLLVEEGGFLYDSDGYSDELPYWDTGHGRPHLIVPYQLDCNDMRFAMPQGFSTGEQFFGYLRDSFDQLYQEGETRPKMLSVGLHPRLSGRPGRAWALARFLDHVQAHEHVWICTREQIALHWSATHPFRA